MSKLSFVFREFKLFFNDSEKSRPFSYTCANFCLLDFAIVDLSSENKFRISMLVAENVTRIKNFMNQLCVGQVSSLIYEARPP